MSTTIAVGHDVAMTLKPGAAPLRCYVGRVQAVDDRGVRVTLMDWIVGGYVKEDLFVPWEQMTSVLVATDEHDRSLFAEAAAEWQTQMGDRKKDGAADD